MQDDNISDYIVNSIIDQCSLIIDEIDDGYIIEQSDLQDLVYLENVLSKIILKIEKQKILMNNIFDILPDIFYAINVIAGCILALLLF